MIAAILGKLSGIFGGLYGYLIVAAVAGCFAAFGTGYVVHKMDNSTLNALKLADQVAEVQAVQLAGRMTQASDKVSLDAAVAEAQAQQKIVTRTITLTKEIQTHVSDSATCVTFGFLRSLNAAAGAGAIPVPASEPDAACSGVSWRELASDLTDDYGSANANAEQLTALQDWTKQQAAVKP